MPIGPSAIHPVAKGQGTLGSTLIAAIVVKECHMGKTRLTVILALLCMAVACREAHIDDASEQAFNDSLMAMYAEHSVTEAQAFGAQLLSAQQKLGKEAVRKSLHGMNWTEARAYLERSSAAPAKG